MNFTLLDPLGELLDRLAQSIWWVVGGHVDLKKLLKFKNKLNKKLTGRFLCCF